MKVADFFDNEFKMNKPTSSVEKRLEKIMEKEVDFLSVSEIAFLIRQNIGGSLILSKAARIIEDQPFIRAEYYSGDLLVSFLEADPESLNDIESFGIDGYGLYGEVEGLVDTLKKNIEIIETSLYRTKFLRKA